MRLHCMFWKFLLVEFEKNQESAKFDGSTVWNLILRNDLKANKTGSQEWWDVCAYINYRPLSYFVGFNLYIFRRKCSARRTLVQTNWVRSFKYVFSKTTRVNINVEDLWLFILGIYLSLRIGPSSTVWFWESTFDLFDVCAPINRFNFLK